MIDVISHPCDCGSTAAKIPYPITKVERKLASGGTAEQFLHHVRCDACGQVRTIKSPPDDVFNSCRSMAGSPV